MLLSIQCQPLRKIYTHIIKFFPGEKATYVIHLPLSLLAFLVRVHIRQLRQRVPGWQAHWRWAMLVGQTLRAMGKKEDATGR